MWVSLVTAVWEVADLSSGSLPHRGSSRKVHRCCPRAVSRSEPRAGAMRSWGCVPGHVFRDKQWWPPAEGSGTWPAESPLQDLPVVFNRSWARKCEQNYQILCETNSTSSSGDADVPLLRDLTLPTHHKSHLRQRLHCSHVSSCWVQVIISLVPKGLISLGSVLLTTDSQLSALESFHV